MNKRAADDLHDVPPAKSLTLASPTAVSYFGRIPLELLVCIFAFLKWTVVSRRLSLVCKDWRAVALRMQESISIATQRRHSLAAPQDLLERLGLKKLTLSCFRNPVQGELYLPDVRELVLNCCFPVVETHTSVTSADTPAFVGQYLSFFRFPSLTALHVTLAEHHTHAFGPLVQSSSTLKTLEVFNSPASLLEPLAQILRGVPFPALRDLRLSRQCTTGLASVVLLGTLASQLTQLGLECAHGQDSPHFLTPLLQPSLHLPSLTSLNLHIAYSVREMNQFLDHCPSLVNLGINMTGRVLVVMATRLAPLLVDLKLGSPLASSAEHVALCTRLTSLQPIRNPQFSWNELTHCDLALPHASRLRFFNYNVPATQNFNIQFSPFISRFTSLRVLRLRPTILSAMIANIRLPHLEEAQLSLAQVIGQPSVCTVMPVLQCILTWSLRVVKIALKGETLRCEGEEDRQTLAQFLREADSHPACEVLHLDVSEVDSGRRLAAMLNRMYPSGLHLKMPAKLILPLRNAQQASETAVSK